MGLGCDLDDSGRLISLLLSLLLFFLCLHLSFRLTYLFIFCHYWTALCACLLLLNIPHGLIVYFPHPALEIFCIYVAPFGPFFLPLIDRRYFR